MAVEVPGSRALMRVVGRIRQWQMSLAI